MTDEDQIWCALRGVNVPISECVDGCAAPEQRPVCWLPRPGHTAAGTHVGFLDGCPDCSRMREPIPVVSGDVIEPWRVERGPKGEYVWEASRGATLQNGETLTMSVTYHFDDEGMEVSEVARVYPEEPDGEADGIGTSRTGDVRRRGTGSADGPSNASGVVVGPLPSGEGTRRLPSPSGRTAGEGLAGPVLGAPEGPSDGD